MQIKITEIPKDVTLIDNNDNNAVYTGNQDNKVLGMLRPFSVITPVTVNI